MGTTKVISSVQESHEIIRRNIAWIMHVFKIRMSFISCTNAVSITIAMSITSLMQIQCCKVCYI